MEQTLKFVHQLGSYRLLKHLKLKPVLPLQEVIMIPLDHKNLDKDVPYFTTVVRCVPFQAIVWKAIIQAIITDLFYLFIFSFLTETSFSSAHVAQQKTWLFTSGTTWWRFSRPACSMRSRFMRPTRTWLCIEESSEAVFGLVALKCHSFLLILG